MYRLKKCHGGIFYSGPYARLRHQSAVIIIVLGVLGKNVDISIDIDILDIDIDEAFLLSSRDHIEFSVSQVDWALKHFIGHVVPPRRNRMLFPSDADRRLPCDWPEYVPAQKVLWWDLLLQSIC
jgi:hypothetical protein